MPFDEHQLVEKYRDRILYFALRRLRDRTAAEELAHDVLLTVIEAAREGKIRDESKLGGFVFGVASNKVKKWLRERGRDERGQTALSQDSKTETFESPEANFLVEEEREIVRAALTRLSEEDRKTLVKCYRDPESLERIAEEMGVSYAALRKRKSRALERLRKVVEGVTESI